MHTGPRVATLISFGFCFEFKEIFEFESFLRGSHPAEIYVKKFQVLSVLLTATTRYFYALKIYCKILFQDEQILCLFFTIEQH
jgi:hypothetical protein